MSTSDQPRTRRGLLYGALGVLYLLHNDLWLWNDQSLVLGLPVGLLYHVGFCLVTSAVLAMLVRWAWPEFNDHDTPGIVGEGLAPSRSEREGARPSPTIANASAPAREAGGEWSPARPADPPPEGSDR